MSALSIQPTYPIFTESDGLPLENGYIWIGTANLDPQGNPINVYWDAALTQLAAQPIRTLGGYPSNNGTPARLYVNSDYSIRVMNKNASVVYSAPSATERYSGVVVTGLDASNIDFLQAGTGAVVQTVQTKLRKTVDVKDFGATGDGVTNDTVAIQNAIDSLAATGGVVHFPPGLYRIARNVGTNDRWGIKITSSNIALKGDQASLQRFNTDISTYALAYPLVFVGTPDSNVASATQNVLIEGLTFIGQNVRHSSPGNAVFDFRTAIVFKNSKNTQVQNCNFTVIDSACIWYESIASYDYANNEYFNTTKNYQSKITNCQFVANSHSTAGRAQIHAICTDGADNVIIESNYFEWTDVCLSGEATYDTADQPETDTFTYASPAGRNALGPVKRQGKTVVFSNNNCYNCSEHPAYPAMVNVVISGNTFTTDAPTICDTNPIQTRSRGISVTGNTVIGYSTFITITTPSSQVTVSGNSYYANDVADKEGGAIQIQSAGLASYITNRSSYLTMMPMGDISITGNTVVGPETFVPTGQLYQNAMRVYTDSYDATNFPDGQILGITVSGNTFRNWQNGFYFIDDQYRNMVISNNVLRGKPFTEAGFNGSTTMLTRSVILTYGQVEAEGRYASFVNNTVYGAKYFHDTFRLDAPAGSLYSPEPIQGNRLDYIQNIKTAVVREFNALNHFVNNVGVLFLDRSFSTSMMMNSLSDGTGSTELKWNFEYGGGPPAALLFYPADSGPPIRLNQKGTWTPTQGAGLTVVGSFSSAGEYVRYGNMVTINGYVQGSTSVACAATSIMTGGLPFAPDNATVAFYTGTASNSARTSGSQIAIDSVSINSVGAITAASRIYFTATYFSVLI